MQPAVAVFFAIRDGLNNARRGNVPYFWAIFTEPSRRMGTHSGRTEGGSSRCVVARTNSTSGCLIPEYKLLWIVRAGEDAPIFAHRLSICHSYLAYPTGPRRLWRRYAFSFFKRPMSFPPILRDKSVSRHHGITAKFQRSLQKESRRPFSARTSGRNQLVSA